MSKECTGLVVGFLTVLSVGFSWLQGAGQQEPEVGRAEPESAAERQGQTPQGAPAAGVGPVKRVPERSRTTTIPSTTPTSVCLCVCVCVCT